MHRQARAHQHTHTKAEREEHKNHQEYEDNIGKISMYQKHRTSLSMAHSIDQQLYFIFKFNEQGEE